MEIEIILELGLNIEIIEESKMIQKLYCDISKVVGKKGKTKFTSEEKKKVLKLNELILIFLKNKYRK